ncbi:MAG: metalloregulator ArsR/SmtB family transcription factor [Pseudomonadota bacterium]
MSDLAAIEDIEQADAVFAALGHPARRQILLSVYFRGGCNAGDIARRFDCSWPTTSRHLATLVKSGLLEVDKRGRSRVYTANATLLREILQRWANYFS